jgi:DNA recombination protein RmuC
MIQVLIGIAILLQIAGLALLWALWRRQESSDAGALKSACAALEKGQERLEALVRDEIAANRREQNEQARLARDETNVALHKLSEQFTSLTERSQESGERLSDRLSTSLRTFGQHLTKQFNDLSAQEKTQSDRLRDETTLALKNLGEWLGTQLGNHLKAASDAQKDQLASFDGQLKHLVQTNKQDAGQLREELIKTLTQLSDSLTKQVTDSTALQGQRFDQFETRLSAFTTNNTAQLAKMREVIESCLVRLQEDSTVKWEQKRVEDVTTATQSRQEMNTALQLLADSVTKNVHGLGEVQRGHFDSFTSRMDKISENTDKRLEILRGVVDERLKSLQDDNAQKLDQMRQTVDEKLQGTLDQRLGESFKLVSERLEQVYKGLGEMQTLANGVGDLKKVLTNVKTRGTWGEVQLGNLLEQMLTPQQYATNVATIPGSNERVEFAIRLPGREEGQDVVWLPIDAKFPQEDYARLVEAHEAGNVEAVEAIGKQLEAQVKKCAQDICAKYIQAPYTTDFGIMFLPIEGLYAEVIRRTHLVDVLQRECRITIAGPTTLAAILNSLQMGFRTLAIQKRSSEVWGTLSAVKTEFVKYGEVLDAVQKKLKEASHKIDDTRVRSRAIERKLRDVEMLPVAELQAEVPLLEMDAVELALQLDTTT